MMQGAASTSKLAELSEQASSSSGRVCGKALSLCMQKFC